jgi:hypothetical protein
MYKLSTFLFVLLFSSISIFAQDGAKTKMVDASLPFITEGSISAIF